jgi:hypothetical protein
MRHRAPLLANTWPRACTTRSTPAFAWVVRQARQRQTHVGPNCTYREASHE